MNEINGTKNRLFVMSGVLLALLLSALDQTIVATAMPKIVAELNGLSQLSWVFTAYLLSSTITIPLYGKLSDIYGRKIFFIFGIIIFLVGSGLSGVSQSIIQLIIFRALQGIGGGAIMINALAVIGDIFPPAERGKWQGLTGAVFGVASVAGPLLGGWLTDYASWRWIFYVNMPVGILALIAIIATLPNVAAHKRDKPIDYLGAVLIACALVPFLLAFVWGGTQYPWFSPAIIGLLLCAFLFIAAFIFSQRKAADPILPLALFSQRSFTISVASTFLISLGMFGAIVYIPLFVQGVIGINATNSGLVLTPMMLALVCASIVSGRIISHTGEYKYLAILGMMLGTAGMFLFSRMDVATGNGEVARNMIVLGMGLGLTMPIFTIVVQSAFSHERLGVVTASLQLFRNIGSTIGVAFLGGVFNNQLAGRLQVLTAEPQFQPIHQAMPNFSLDANSLQEFFGSSQNTASFAKGVPPQASAALQQAFFQLTQGLKEAFAQSLSDVFFIGTFLMALACIIVFFLPQITLRKSHLPALEEIGEELQEDLGQDDAEREEKFLALEFNLDMRDISQLRSYVKEMQAMNIPVEKIVGELGNAGWPRDMILHFVSRLHSFQETPLYNTDNEQNRNDYYNN